MTRKRDTAHIHLGWTGDQGWGVRERLASGRLSRRFTRYRRTACERTVEEGLTRLPREGLNVADAEFCGECAVIFDFWRASAAKPKPLTVRRGRELRRQMSAVSK